ncbi:MAG: sulfurtransferase [Pedosphaera sp.]|nr:sulfurtransferase [Pedosphaera sp.]
MSVQLSATELAALLKTAHPPRLLDVRELEEHAFASLPGSTLIPLGEIHQRAAEIESWKQEDIVVYCHHGIRSLHAIGQLRALGFTKLRNLSGGIDAWSAAVDSSVPRY